MRVIDLLNKISNGKEVPNKIRFDNKEWNRVYGEKNVIYIDETDNDLFVYFFRRNTIFTLNDVIEEPKEIKKLDENNTNVLTNIIENRKKINEIIDKLNSM